MTIGLISPIYGQGMSVGIYLLAVSGLCAYLIYCHMTFSTPPEHIIELEQNELVLLGQERIRRDQKEYVTRDHIVGKVEEYTYSLTYDYSCMFSEERVIFKRDIGKVSMPEVPLKLEKRKSVVGRLKSLIRKQTV